MVKISVVMPVYNDEKNLEKSIGSILNQTLKDIEVICIDDGSTDNSLNVLKDFSKLDNRIIVLSQENKGSGAARNLGIDSAKGEYIAFLDSDDYIIDENSYLCLYYEAKIRNMDMVSGGIRFISTYGVYEEFLCFKPIKEIGIKDVDEYGLPWYFYKNIFKKSFLVENNIKFPNLLRGQDPVFFTEILSKLKSYLEVPIMYYAYHTPSGVNKINDSLKYHDYIVHYYQVFKILINNKNFSNTINEYFKTFVQFSEKEVFIETENELNSILEVFNKISLLFSNYGDVNLINELYESFKSIISKVEIKHIDISVSPTMIYDLFSENIVIRDDSFKPKLSLILFICNSEENLRKCLDSLIEQSLKDIELICIVNGKNNDSLNLLKEYKKINSRLNIFLDTRERTDFSFDNDLIKLHGEFINFSHCNVFEKDYCENIFEYNKNIFSKDKLTSINSYYDKKLNKLDITNKKYDEYVTLKENRISMLNDKLSKKEYDELMLIEQLKEKEEAQLKLVNELKQKDDAELRLVNKLKNKENIENSLKKQIHNQNREIEYKNYFLEVYEKNLSNNCVEIEYYKNNHGFIKDICHIFSYVYLIFKSSFSTLIINVKLFNYLKNNNCFDTGYYLNHYPEIKNSIFYKYFSPELHYVCFGFDEKKYFNSKNFNCTDKQSLLNNIKYNEK